jgi:hypothetical protein
MYFSTNTNRTKHCSKSGLEATLWGLGELTGMECEEPSEVHTF